MSASGKRGFWRTFFGTAFRPWRTLRDFETDPAGPKKGIIALVLVLFVYFLIVGSFLLKGHTAMEPSALPVPADEQYNYQIWYQGPLFFLDTLMVAGLLVLGARAMGEKARFGPAFSRLCFASAVPMAFTTMIVELAMAAIMFFDVVSREEFLDFLLGRGAWFMTLYQVAGVVWIAALFILAGFHTVKKSRWRGVVLGVAALAVYAFPIALLIR